MEIKKGIVLDEPIIEALLSVAIQEGLMDSDPKIGDGYVGKILKKTYSNDMKERAFEFLMLGGKIITPFRFPRDWNGELVEKGIIVPNFHNDWNNETDVETTTLSNDIIISMLQMRGISLSENELMKKYSDFLEKTSPFEEKIKNGFYDNYSPFVQVLHNECPDVFDSKYTEQDIHIFEMIQNEMRKVSPILSCMNDYSRVISCSLQNNSLCSLPVNFSENTITRNSSKSENIDRISLLKITCKQFHRTPIGYNLKDTIKLSESSEALALRAKIEQWITILQNNDGNNMDIVLNEIEYARKQLKWTKQISIPGIISTVIGFPISLMGDSIISGIGITAATIGVISLVGVGVLKRISRWAMLGV